VIVAEHFTSSPQAHTALIDKQVGRSVTPIGGVHDSGGSCGFECKQEPRRSKKAATFFYHRRPGALAPSPSARKPASCRKVPRWDRRQGCSAQALLWPPCPWVATNGQETLVACCHYRQARTNISGQVGRQCQTRMHEPRRIRRQKPRAKLPNPAGIGTAD